jgi:hypothetical protein
VVTDPARLLELEAENFRRKNEEYGSTYNRIGEVLALLFPDGVILKTPQDHVRYNLFIMGINKYMRYAVNFAKGGHIDSTEDLMSYAAMLHGVDIDEHKIN